MGPFLKLNFLLLALLMPAVPARAAADRVVVDPPITVRISLVGEGRRSVLGDMLEYDEQGLTLRVRGERQVHRWIDITPHSAFTARYRLISQDNAQHWLELGEFALEIGAEPEAEKALQWALRLDASLEAEVERIRLEAPGRLRDLFEDSGEETGAAAEAEPEAQAGEPEAHAGEPEAQAGGGAFGGPSVPFPEAPAGVALFEPVSPEQAARAMEQAQKAAERSLRKLEVKWRRLETQHFVVFTDWEPVDDEFLEASLEQAYRLVAGEFGIPPEMNIFVGKLPVYMFDEHALFMRYAHEIDGQKGFNSSVAGYYTGRTDGMGKLVMSKPKQTDRYELEVARQIWRRNLTHEFSHAFLARYRSNAFVPRWLNEGLAEMIAEKVYPRYGAQNTARMIARNGKSIAVIFEDHGLPGAEMYPVMLTLVQALHDKDPQQFRGYIDRIKAGEDAQKLLRELYDVDYRGLEAAWRRHMLEN